MSWLLVFKFDEKISSLKTESFITYGNEYHFLFAFFQVFRKETYCYTKSFYSVMREVYDLLFLQRTLWNSFHFIVLYSRELWSCQTTYRESYLLQIYKQLARNKPLGRFRKQVKISFSMNTARFPVIKRYSEYSNYYDHYLIAI